MNESLKFLNRLARFTRLKPELFYSINLYSNEIILQCIKSNSIDFNLSKFKFNEEYDWYDKYILNIKIRIVIR